jgi:hypothetical protein
VVTQRPAQDVIDDPEIASLYFGGTPGQTKGRPA